MKFQFILIGVLIFSISCNSPVKRQKTNEETGKLSEIDTMLYDAEEIKSEMLRSWKAYKAYAWGYDVLLPLSKSGYNWYEVSLGISPFDAYSTLALMGLDKEAKEIEDYALAKHWDQDVYVQVFEVNIRILGGLLAIYDLTKKPKSA